MLAEGIKELEHSFLRCYSTKGPLKLWKKIDPSSALFNSSSRWERSVDCGAGISENCLVRTRALPSVLISVRKAPSINWDFSIFVHQGGTTPETTEI